MKKINAFYLFIGLFFFATLISAEEVPSIQTVSLNGCTAKIPLSFIEENNTLARKNLLIINPEQFNNDLITNFSITPIIESQNIQSILSKVASGTNEASELSPEDINCYLQSYINISVNNWTTLLNDNFSQTISLFLNQEKYQDILNKLVLEVEKKIQNINDFKILNDLKPELANLIYKSTNSIQEVYIKTSLDEKNKVYVKETVKNNFLQSLLISDSLFTNFRNLSLVNAELNKNLPSTHSHYRSWDSVSADVEKETFDIKKLSYLLENYSLLKALETINWQDDKKCTFFEKIIRPLTLYQYSIDQNKNIDQLHASNLTCARTLLDKWKLFQVSSDKYFSQWCEEKKDQSKCKVYFTSDWLKAVRQCNRDQQCTQTNLENKESFFYNKKIKTDQVNFYMSRIKYFSDSSSTINFPLEAKTICKNHICKADLVYFEPLKLFESLVGQYNRSNFNNCNEDNECVLKELNPKSFEGTLYYPINKTYMEFDDNYFVTLFDDAIYDNQNDLGKGYFKTNKIQSWFNPALLKAQCENKKCVLTRSN